MFDKILLNAPEFRQIATSLNKYDPKSAIPLIGSLLTIPELQANTIRLETLVHLAVAYCDGSESVPVPQIGRWLNNYLENSNIARLEDPSEDVFVGNVRTSKGNRRIFNGIWPSNDYFVQTILDIMDDPKVPREWRDLLRPVVSLLALSESVAERLSLRRWHSEQSISGGTIELPSSTQLAERARAVTFSRGDLRTLGLVRDILEPFVLSSDDRQTLSSETTANSTLERFPLLDLNGDLVFALPHAASPAIVRFVLGELRKSGYLRAFTNELANFQTRQVMVDWFGELKGDLDPLQLPPTDGVVPSFDNWLFRYDVDKYLHVVLLHDRLDLLEIQGLSSQLLYLEELRAGLEDYLHQVSRHCESLSDFAEAMTLLIVGGLGREIVLGFGKLPNQRRWSILRITDVVMLATENDRSAARFLKCMWQKAWVEREGVRFMSINGDYDFYCFWRQQDYRLVPGELPLSTNTLIGLPTDCALPVRQQVRNLTDSHVVETVRGLFVHVMRLHRGSYFKSLANQPIYASLDHIDAFELAGVVETERGPSWLVVKPCDRTDPVFGFAHEVWRQFIDFFGDLILEMEAICKNAPAGAIEIRLNLDDVVVPENYSDFRPPATPGRPEIFVKLKQRSAEVKFPSDLIRSFQQPENYGERMVLRSIEQALIALYQENSQETEETVIEMILDRLLGNSAIRLFHVFPVDPLQHLLSRQKNDPILSNLEDFAFAKLGLSAGCTGENSNRDITSKPECNRFLHRVVQKIHNRLRSHLQQFDRTSVIRSALEVCEAASQDRDRWKRTAQALFAQYTATDDVQAVARQRELDRTNASIAARTIIEFAICDCPYSGGRKLSRWNLDVLLAEAMLLIEVAMHSDAVKHELMEPRIKLQANGEYITDRSFRQSVIDPFVAAYYRERFESAASNYAAFYRTTSSDSQPHADEVFNSDFVDAFKSEFGLTPQDVSEGYSALARLAIDRDCVVVESTLGDIKARLTADRVLTPDACDRFIDTFSIFHRPKWENPPQGFRKNDLFPWRYNRRLSASVKPILVFGEKDEDKVIFGAGTLANGCIHLLDRSENGRLPQEFFTSREMKEYIGRVNDARGHAFARCVADQMRERKWLAKTEVNMTELGAPADLGDVDVLAWKSDGTIRLIECKRLTFARTIAEIANICKRFQGEAKDELARHLRRVEWIRRNPQCLRNIVGFVPDPSRIDHRLITNTQVPMKYLDSLPMDPDKIGPLE